VILATPTVMLSSTITDLLVLRQAVKRKVDSAGVANAWLFEEHAAAAGSRPEEQYLGIARACDVYVVIVTDRLSEATEAEYQAAFGDNPEKILTFFLGEGSSEVSAFRELLDKRHTRIKRDGSDELIEEISRSIIEAVETGKLLRPALLREIDDRIERSRTLIADLPLIIEPRIQGDGQEGYARDLLAPNIHAALSGIGGSGKTICAAVTARRAAGDARTLPVLATVTHDVTQIEDLIMKRFSAIRFQLSSDLLVRWATEGRLFIVVDGIEAVEGRNRRRLINSISEWSERYPRCGIVLCVRQLSPGELDSFVNFAMAPFSPAQLADVATSLGLQPVLHFPEQVADIARWPMWGTALLVYGPQSQTGLDLLHSLVGARLESAGMSSAVEVEEIRTASSYLAHAIWPDTECTAGEALTYLAAWSTDVDARARFEPRTAEDLLSRMGEAGLVEIAAAVSFPHRLFATILASEWASKDSVKALDSASELAPFVAGLLDDDLHFDALSQLLNARGVFTAARFLRLSPSRNRANDVSSDVLRMASSLKASTPSGQGLDVITGNGWIAWRDSQADDLKLEASHDDYQAWRELSKEAIEFWLPSPFLTRTPEFVAAIQILRKFRSEVLELNPGGDPHGGMPASRVREMLKDRSAVEALAVQRLDEWRDALDGFLSKLGISDMGNLRAPNGQPRIMIHLYGGGDPWADISWVEGVSEVTFLRTEEEVRPTEFYRRMGLDAILSDNAVSAAYADLKTRIEAALGCRLTAQAWDRPELVSAWVW
jgi:hypothetical protein